METSPDIICRFKPSDLICDLKEIVGLPVFGRRCIMRLRAVPERETAFHGKYSP